MEQTLSPQVDQPLAPVYGPFEAARALNISTSYVRKLYLAGVARPTIPLGASGRRLYSRADLGSLAATIAPRMV